MRADILLIGSSCILDTVYNSKYYIERFLWSSIDKPAQYNFLPSSQANRNTCHIILSPAQKRKNMSSALCIHKKMIKIHNKMFDNIYYIYIYYMS